MLAESLSFIHYDFTTVPRLADALALLDSHVFSAVLLDLNLLDSNGIASVSAVHNSHPHLPLIVYSGEDDFKTRQLARLCGATHYVVKGKQNGFALKFMLEQAMQTAAA
jgi:two-component system response regulator HydG